MLHLVQPYGVATVVIDHEFGAGRALINGSHEAVDHGARHGLYLCVCFRAGRTTESGGQKGRLFARRRVVRARTARRGFPIEEDEGGEEKETGMRWVHESAEGVRMQQCCVLQNEREARVGPSRCPDDDLVYCLADPNLSYPRLSSPHDLQPQIHAREAAAAVGHSCRRRLCQNKLRAHSPPPLHLIDLPFPRPQLHTRAHLPLPLRRSPCRP